MTDITKSETYQAALNHVIKNAEFRESIQIDIDYITQQKGNVYFCTGMMVNYAHANAIVSWFRDHNLIAFKEWCYIGAKLERMVFQHVPYEWFPAYKFFSPLLSDNAEIIDWYRQHTLPYYITPDEEKDRDNPKQPAFHGYQMLLALNHKWDLLRQRCEQILSMDLKRDRKYLIDHRFYLALANGDKAGMESVLTELTSPKVARIRNHEFAFTFTEHFIATHAVIYAKLAWWCGYELELDSMWIPKEWLPIQPLNDYPEHWDFLKQFDLWTPFDEYDDWSPQKHDLLIRAFSSQNRMLT